MACAALTTTTAHASTSFTTGVLPADPSSGLDHNRDAEPGLASSPDGTLALRSPFNGTFRAASVSAETPSRPTGIGTDALVVPAISGH